MGHQSTVYGVIDCFKGRRGNVDADSLNLAAVAGLPETDGWPFLVRDMFSVSQSDRVAIDYTYRLIHFAASLKEVEFDWPAWLDKFEQLLARIDGMAARVHLDTVLVGSHSYDWVRDTASIDAWPPKWIFQGGIRDFEI
ncbi:hypothetical protein EJP67_24965 [Variovorax guangxiensis]|uniref:Uncharacterized protein n=1 Tax=Variovorax guangxiensis TaxID=1775474 RepID=A0A433MR40_9BURK|nr:hypothetical protein [Variovorax guangxiensis]RUR70311.1 hypothetical protein EJP67_24965 [Variovorax guangxiensis]